MYSPLALVQEIRDRRLGREAKADNSNIGSKSKSAVSDPLSSVMSTKARMPPPIISKSSSSSSGNKAIGGVSVSSAASFNKKVIPKPTADEDAP